MSTLNVAIGFLIITVACLCGFVVLTVRSRKAKGDDRRRYARLLLLWSMGFTPIVSAQAIFSFRQSGHGTLGLIIMLPLLALVLVMGVLALRNMRKDAYFRKLYELDPGCCGRCGYDLTGNVSGVCPDCGWKLPDRQR